MVTSTFSESDRFYDCVITTLSDGGRMPANSCQLFVTSDYFREVMKRNPGLREFDLPACVHPDTLRKIMAFVNHGRDEFEATDEEIRALVRANHVLRVASLVEVVEALWNQQMQRIWLEEAAEVKADPAEVTRDDLANDNVFLPLRRRSKSERELDRHLGDDNRHLGKESRHRRVSDESQHSSKMILSTSITSALFSLKKRGWVSKFQSKVLRKKSNDDETVFSL